MKKTVDLIYKLESIDAENGIDIFEIAPILMQFGELVRSANNVLDFEQKIDVRVKPFKEGSWITEFVLQNTPVENLMSFIHGNQGQDIMILLALLGLSVKDGITGVAGVIRFTKGLVTNYKANNNGTITYFNENGEKIEVSLEEHKLVQSPIIQNNFYNCTIKPLDKFPDASAVSFKANKENNQEQKFTQADKAAFEEYAATELIEDVEDNITNMSGVLLKPKRGSYSGTEKQYSFIIGENTIYPVTIEDENFLTSLQSGDIRLFSEDVLRVDLKLIQTKNTSNKVNTSYVITRVNEYIKYEKSKQISFDDIE